VQKLSLMNSLLLLPVSCTMMPLVFSAPRCFSLSVSPSLTEFMLAAMNVYQQTVRRAITSVSLSDHATFLTMTFWLFIYFFLIGCPGTQFSIQQRANRGHKIKARPVVCCLLQIPNPVGLLSVSKVAGAAADTTPRFFLFKPRVQKPLEPLAYSTAGV